jgi:hypothetical protein
MVEFHSAIVDDAMHGSITFEDDTMTAFLGSGGRCMAYHQTLMSSSLTALGVKTPASVISAVTRPGGCIVY